MLQLKAVALPALAVPAPEQPRHLWCVAAGEIRFKVSEQEAIDAWRSNGASVD